MRAIQYIIQSYFQRGFLQVLILVVAIFTLLITSLVTLGADLGYLNYRLNYFLLAMFAASGLVSDHLRAVTADDACSLIPYYRKKQLITAGILLAPFVFVPVLTAFIKGLPVLSLLAILLSIMSAVIVAIDRSFENGFRSLVMLIVLWLVYELLGFELSAKFIGSFSEMTGFGSNSFFALLVIGISLVLSIWFSVRYLQGEIKETRDTDSLGFDCFTMNYDRQDSITTKLVCRKMHRLITSLQKRVAVFLDHVRLYQYALFDPRSSLMFDTMLFYAFAFMYLLLFFVFFYSHISFATDRSFSNTPPTIFIMYIMFSLNITREFLQHRDRLPSLWLSSRLASRRQFAKAVFATYMMVCGRKYLQATLLTLPFSLIIPGCNYPAFLLFMAAGVVPFIVLAAFSLLLSDRVTSYNCIGWWSISVVVVLPTYVLGFRIFKLLAYPLVCISILLVLVLLSVLLLLYAFNVWADTEMDFKGPELSL